VGKIPIHRNPAFPSRIGRTLLRREALDELIFNKLAIRVK